MAIAAEYTWRPYQFFRLRFAFSIKSALYRESTCNLISKMVQDPATWRHCNLRLQGRLHLGCLWALFCLLLLVSKVLSIAMQIKPMYLIIHDAMEFFQKRRTWLQTKVAKHPKKGRAGITDVLGARHQAAQHPAGTTWARKTKAA